MSNGKTYKRWYDRNPHLAQGVKLLILLPDEVKTIISEALITLANREFNESERETAFRTLGSEKIMGLHKSKNRRREYDINDTLHKAMNYLYMLSDDGQDFMAEHILNMIKYIQEYFATCQKFQMTSEPEHVARIAYAYVNSGSEGVAKFLKQLREEFYLKVFSPDNGVKASLELLDTLQGQAEVDDRINLATKDGNQGMKLSKQEID